MSRRDTVSKTFGPRGHTALCPPYACCALTILMSMAITACITPRDSCVAPGRCGVISEVESGLPIEGVAVVVKKLGTQWQPAHGRTIEVNSYTTTTNSKGQYVLPQWADPQPYSRDPNKPDYRLYWREFSIEVSKDGYKRFFPSGSYGNKPIDIQLLRVRP